MNFAKIVESIGLQVVKAIMTLIAFIPILGYYPLMLQFLI